MAHSISLVIKDERVLCEKKKDNVNIHSMVHPITKTKISEVCDSWETDCPKWCRYYATSKK